MTVTVPDAMSGASPIANLVEPPRLLVHWRNHPPLGFGELPDAPPLLPAFSAPFDLLTTLDDGLKRRLRGWPGFARWSKWLRFPTAFVGSTVSEYAPLPRGAEPRALARALREALGERFRMLVVKDLPQHSPLLPEADNLAAEALAQACVAEGFVLLEGQALAYVPITFSTIDGYFESLSSGRRKNLRRKLRSRAGLDVRTVPTGAAFNDDAVVDHFYALYCGVYAQSEVHFDELSRCFFAALLRDGASGGIVFEYRHAGELIGWNLCFEHGGQLIDKYIGFAYPQARAHNLYFVSWIVNLEHALARGLSHYVAGWTDPEVKAQLGARFTFTRHAVYIRNPLLRALGRRFSHLFESDAGKVPGTTP